MSLLTPETILADVQARGSMELNAYVLGAYKRGLRTRPDQEDYQEFRADVLAMIAELEQTTDLVLVHDLLKWLPDEYNDNRDLPVPENT